MSLWNCIFIGLRFALMRPFAAVLLVPTLKIKDFIHMYKIWISNMRGFSHNFGCSEIIDFSLDLTSMTRWCSSFSSSPVPITYTREEPWTTFAVSVRVLAARLSLNCSWNCVHLKTGVWFLVFRQGWQIYDLKTTVVFKTLFNLRHKSTCTACLCLGVSFPHLYFTCAIFFFTFCNSIVEGSLSTIISFPTNCFSVIVVHDSTELEAPPICNFFCLTSLCLPDHIHHRRRPDVIRHSLHHCPLRPAVIRHNPGACFGCGYQAIHS